jgi:hypothetical protein
MRRSHIKAYSRPAFDALAIRESGQHREIVLVPIPVCRPVVVD